MTELNTIFQLNLTVEANNTEKIEENNIHYINAKLAVMDWLANQILTMSVTDYILQYIANSQDPYALTVSSIRQLLEMKTLLNKQVLNETHIPTKNLNAFNAMWALYLKNQLPILTFNVDDINGYSLDSDEFANLYAGSLYMEKYNKLGIYTFNETVTYGKNKWAAAKDNTTLNSNIALYTLPALISMAQRFPERLRDKKNNDTVLMAVTDYLDYRTNCQKRQTQLNSSLNKLQSAYEQPIPLKK